VRAQCAGRNDLNAARSSAAKSSGCSQEQAARKPRGNRRKSAKECQGGTSVTHDTRITCNERVALMSPIVG